VNRERSWSGYSAGVDLEHFERMVRSCNYGVAARVYLTMEAARSELIRRHK
jgi:hypothetical protein